MNKELYAHHEEANNKFNLAEYYRVSISSGLRSIPSRDWKYGLRRIVNPLSYPRPEEFREVVHELSPNIDHGRVLDMGSPKLPLIILAKHRPGLEFYSTDIMGDFVDPTARFLTNMGFGERIGKDIHLETQDARRLTYPDNFFDWVYSVSVIEHIVDDKEWDIEGDSRAMQEIARVLKPEGVVTLTVPFDVSGFRNEYINGDVYERSGKKGTKTFYQRYYDADSLFERIIIPSGLACEALVLIGEPGLRIERGWNKIPLKAKVPLLPFQGIAGSKLFRKIDINNQMLASGVALRLVKPH